MRRVFAVFVFVCAVCISTISKLIAYKHSRRQKESQRFSPTIFVGLVSYCDSNWLAQVEQLIQSASEPHRLYFGIVEYVKDASDSQEERIPSDWRNNMQVYTVSQRIARSQRRARNLCLQKMYHDENYLLFTKSAVMERGWDVKLIHCLSEASVISMHIDADTNVPLFPCISADGASISFRRMTVMEERPVKTLLWHPDFVFSTLPATSLLLTVSDPVETTALLQDNGFEVHMCGMALAKRAPHPRGVKERALSHPPTPAAVQFKKGIGVDATSATPYAQLGLTPNATSDEQISKYGSVVAVRVAAQSIEASRSAELD